jgi:DNA-binding SARP family transcriptional activator/Tfp pilus assembly protein PilF
VTPQLRLRTFGGLALDAADGARRPEISPRRLALLAVIGSARGGIARDSLLSMFWPESTEERARNALNQALFVLRRDLPSGAIVVSASNVRLEASIVACDAAQFEEAVEQGALDTAAGLYGGTFLDGVHIRDAAEFDGWRDIEMARLARVYAGVIERLADGAEASGDMANAVRWWQRLAVLDPGNSRIALRLMHACVAARDPAAAIRHANTHRVLLREEFGISCDPGVLELADRIRSGAVLRPLVSAAATTNAGLTPHVESEPATDRVRNVERHTAAASGRHRHRLRATFGVAAVVVLSVSAVIVLNESDRMTLGTPVSYDAVSQPLERPAPIASLPAGSTHSEAAHAFLVQGLHLMNLRRVEDLRRAVDYFERALADDAEFGLAHALLAQAYLLLAGSPDFPSRQARRLAAASAQRALAIDDRISAAHSALALTQQMNRDMSAAERSYLRALQLDPDDALARSWYGAFLMYSGRTSSCVRQLELAHQLDPTAIGVRANLGWGYYFEGRYQRALDMFSSVLELDSMQFAMHNGMGRALQQLGLRDDALAAYRRAVDLGGTNQGRAFLAQALARFGFIEEARSIRGELAANEGAPLILAIVDIGLGEMDQAFSELEAAFEARSQGLAHVAVDPVFDPIRSDARYPRLLALLNVDDKRAVTRP